MFFCPHRLYRLPFNNEPPQIVVATYQITIPYRYPFRIDQSIKIKSMLRYKWYGFCFINYDVGYHLNVSKALCFHLKKKKKKKKKEFGRFRRYFNLSTLASSD